MSYILDALKKSDNERQKGAVPDLQSQHTVYPGFGAKQKKKPKAVWIVLLSIIFVAASVTALFLVAPYMPFSLQIIQKDSATAADTITAEQRKKVHTSPSPSPQAPQAAVPEQQTPPQTTDNSMAAKPEQVQQPVQLPAKADQQQKADTANQPVPRAEAPQKATPRQTVEISPPSQPKQQEQPTQLPEAKLEPVTRPPTEEPTSEETDDTPGSQDSLPYLAELPQDVRTSLPELSFAGHTYSAEPSNRMIIVNNQIKREGQWVEKGLLLEQITWDGVVLNYQGLRFQVNTTR